MLVPLKPHTTPVLSRTPRNTRDRSGSSYIGRKSESHPGPAAAAEATPAFSTFPRERRDLQVASLFVLGIIVVVGIGLKEAPEEQNEA